MCSQYHIYREVHKLQQHVNICYNHIDSDDKAHDICKENRNCKSRSKNGNNNHSNWIANLFLKFSFHFPGSLDWFGVGWSPFICKCCVFYRQFVRSSRCPLVFIMSDSVNGDSSSRSLFPKDLQEELNITNIRLVNAKTTSVLHLLLLASVACWGRGWGCQGLGFSKVSRNNFDCNGCYKN